MLKTIRILLVATLIQLSFATAAYAQFFLYDESKLFVDDEIKKRTIGIEIEFAGLSDDLVITLIKKHFGGEDSQLTIPNGIRQIISSLGQIKLKVEGNAWRYESNGQEKLHSAQIEEDYNNAPREIVFPPLHHEDMFKIQALLNDLKKAGAIGTRPDLAVSLQTNILMGDLLKSQKNVDDLLNLMRVYYAPKHLLQAQQLLNIPDIRSEFLLDPSPGFIKKLMNPNYRPTARELYDDYLYRQSLELLGHKDAWELPLAAAKTLLMSYGREASVPRVVKMTKIRVSSLLIDAFKEDPLSQLYIRTFWALPAPIVEFRVFNNDFNVLNPVNMSLGVIRASQIYGVYDHDELILKLTNIPVSKLVDLRKALKNICKDLLTAP